ncbi:MAG: ABC transporter ATP-binding protein [Bacillota bacterium]|nr:ABC transporter ATP-binding protein [Bacillota bacterium]
MNTLLELKDLSIDYLVKDGKLSAVNSLNLNINRGEIFALVGESGCGKTTVAFSIMRLLQGNEQTSGEILFEGEDLLALEDGRIEKIRGKHIGMIFQNPLDSLNPVYTSGNQVAEAILLDEKNKNVVMEKLLKLYEDVRIPDAPERIHSYPHELSGGMRQRVMIAMMLSRNPQLLIADEPTTALDVTVEAQILKLLKELRDDYGSAILLITHNFGIVAELADRVGIMYAGELVELADVVEIFHHPVHPYSKALMASLPRMTKEEGRLATLDGTVPRIIGEFKGCRFSNRCALAQKRCFVDTPSLLEIRPGHFVQCHNEEVLRGY